MKVRLSICIVAYNDYEEIKAAVSSIEKFSNDQLSKRIYIIDNGVSSEIDKESFLNYISNFSDVEYIDNGENSGFGKGQNRVIDIIESDYHAIVNPDILLLEDTFDKMISWLDEHKDIGMAIPLIIDEEGNRQEVYRKELTVFDMINRRFYGKIFKNRYREHNMHDKDYSVPFQVPFGQGSFLVIRTGLFKMIGGFDENFFLYVEDADLCKRVNQVSKLMYFPQTKVIHKWKAESHKNNALFRQHVRSAIYYFNKWGWKFI